VFLSRTGAPWSEKGLNNAYRRLWVSSAGKKPALAFRVTPHMLRHTFATFELFAESKRTNLAEALAWVRDRLGHRSIMTTTVYVHYLDLIEAPELNQYQEEIDTMCGDR
jgi:integrase